MGRKRNDQSQGRKQETTASDMSPVREDSNVGAPVLLDDSSPTCNHEERKAQERIKANHLKSVKASKWENSDAFKNLNKIIFQRSKRAELVIMNLPHLWSTDVEEAFKYISYCDQLTAGID